MKFVIDANIPYSSLKVFAELGLKAVHVTDVGLGRSSDAEILSYATKRSSIVVTKDQDFGTLVVFSKLPAYGIIILRLPFTYTAEQIKVALRSFLKTIDLKKLPKSITVVELGRYRIRKI